MKRKRVVLSVIVRDIQRERERDREREREIKWEGNKEREKVLVEFESKRRFLCSSIKMCFSLAMIEHERLYVNVEKHKSLSFVWSWSSLVEGDEQLDWPNSQTAMELCHACVA